MNPQIATYRSFEELARSFGQSPAKLKATVARTDRQIVDRLAEGFTRTAEGSKLDKKARLDAATNFTTNALRASLAPAVVEDDQVYLFTPGRAASPILPSRMVAKLGQQFIDWKALTHTGQAQVVGYGTSFRELPFVGYADEMLMSPLAHFGVGMRYDTWDLLRSDLEDVDHEGELRYAAAKAMAELYEEISCWGLPEQGIPGFCRSGTATTCDLPISFGDPAITVEQMTAQLNAIHMWIERLMRGRKVTGIMMPSTHALALKDAFGGVNGEGDNRWPFFKAKHYWLDEAKVQVVEDDRVDQSTGKPYSTWEIWSKGNDFWIEGSPTPIVFGPYVEQETTTVYLFNQHGGAICRDPRNHLRVRMPAV